MISPNDSETVYSDSEISSDESIHESDIDFIDDSDVSSESSNESDINSKNGDEFQDNKCTTFTYIYSNKSLIYFSNKYDSFVELVNNANFDFDYVNNIDYHV